jgi:formate hydrogenlyase subunit 4
LRKLFSKDAVLAENASPVFRTAPYVIFGSMWLAAAMVPIFVPDLPYAPAADVIALTGVFAVARVFLALAAMDIGTAFGGLGARREMFVGFLAEPALLMVFFAASLISQSTSLSTIVKTLAHPPFVFHPSLVFAAAAFLMVFLAENARLPVDNPRTHLELTMIHEAMVLEYSARHLALIEWASSIKLFTYTALGIALFFPYGIALTWGALPTAFLAFVLKFFLAGVLLAVFETLCAKMRLFRVPEFMGMAFLLAVLSMFTHVLLGS